jgi:pSer/pThr/pTyr-binding forkhead associated (FHA) protein/energy-coupling factor transporter ATP-binding protein EcfA2
MPASPSETRPGPASNATASVTLDTRRSARLRSLHPGPLAEDLPLLRSGQVIGRDAGQADLIHAGPNVSRRHAWIGQTGEACWVIRDLASLNGVFVNGQRIEGECRLESGDAIGLGQGQSPDFEFNLTGAPAQRTRTLTGEGPWQIGRNPDSDIALPADLSVSDRHAILHRTEPGLEVRDLGSRNGLWQGGQRSRLIRLKPGDAFMLGHHRLRWVDSAGSDITLELTSLGQAIGLRLDTVSIATHETAEPIELAPGQLHRLQLPRTADHGALMHSLGRDGLIDGKLFSQPWLAEQIDRQRDRVALVENDPGRPPAMTLIRWLHDEALLRLGPDLAERERALVIATTLEALGLSETHSHRLEQLDRLDSALSLVAAGLLTRPGLLVLDARSAALDADDEQALVERLRSLAGTSLTLVVLSGENGIPLRYRPPLDNQRRPLRALRRRPHWSVLACLIRRALGALFRRPAAVASLLGLPVLLMVLMQQVLDLRSGVLAAQAVLLICSPLAALSLGAAREGVPRSLIHRFGLLPDHAAAQALLATSTVLIQFLLCVGLATSLLPPDVWTLASGSGVLLSAAAGMTLGVFARTASQGHAPVALLLASLAGTCQAAWVLPLQLGPLSLLGWTALWSGLALLLGARHRLSRAGSP